MAKRQRPKAENSNTEMPVRANQIPQLVEGSPGQTFYVNHARLDVSNWDVRFRMGQIQEVNAERLTVKEVAIVYMSHAHAKAFATALNGVIEKLEQMIRSESTRNNDTEAKD